MATTEAPIPTSDHPPVIEPTASTDSTAANSSNNRRNNNKSRRPALPLPDPIPEEPAKPYDPPSKEELQKNIDEQNVKLQQCYERLNHTRQYRDQRQKIRDVYKPKFDAARDEFKAANEECRVLFDEHKLVTSKLKELRENTNRNANNSIFNEPVGAGKDGNEAIKDIKDMDGLEKRIREYQYRLETESMPILEEKKIVSKISFLTHKGRDFIKEKKEMEDKNKIEISQRKQTKVELEEKRNQLDTQINTAKAKLEEKKKELDKIRQEQNDEEKKLSESTPKIDRNDEKKKIDEIKANISKLRDDFGDALDKWYLNKRIMIEQQRIARKKKYEARQAELEERRKAWEAEQAQYPEPHPYQAEKDMCSGLTVYLKTLLGETIEKQPLNLRGGEKNPVLKAINGGEAKTAREIESTEKKAFGKLVSGESDGFNDVDFNEFVKKPGKKGRNSRGKQNQASAKAAASSSAAKDTDENSVLKPHSIDYLTAFSKLGIKPPTKLSEARTALQEVMVKAEFYENAPAPTEDEKEKKSGEGAKRTDSGKSGKKTAKTNASAGDAVANGGVDLVNGDDANKAFPGLGSDAPKTKAAENMPSFISVASGASPAPAVTPQLSSATDEVIEDAANDSTGNVEQNEIEGEQDIAAAGKNMEEADADDSTKGDANIDAASTPVADPATADA